MDAYVAYAGSQALSYITLPAKLCYWQADRSRQIGYHVACPGYVNRYYYQHYLSSSDALCSYIDAAQHTTAMIIPIE